MASDATALARWVVGLSCAVFAAAGLPFLLLPAQMTSFVGVSLTTVTADNDVRAVYGGVATGLAVFLAMAVRRSDWLVPALVVVLLTLGGLSMGRFISWIVQGLPDPIGLLLHAAELTGFVLVLFTLRRLE